MSDFPVIFRDQVVRLPQVKGLIVTGALQKLNNDRGYVVQLTAISIVDDEMIGNSTERTFERTPLLESLDENAMRRELLFMWRKLLVELVSLVAAKAMP